MEYIRGWIEDLDAVGIGGEIRLQGALTIGGLVWGFVFGSGAVSTAVFFIPVGAVIVLLLGDLLLRPEQATRRFSELDDAD